MSVDSQDLPRPFGPFTLLRLIAQGGMGAVFLALRPLPDDKARKRKLPAGQEEVCVVKTVRSDLRADREAVGRFLDEARVVQKLHHSRIARTIDAGIIDKTYYLGLEFISGRNLRDVHTRAQKLGKSLPEGLIVHVLADMLEALEHAHTLQDEDTKKPLNIVHRDVSPHNVMLGFDGNTKLIDFGLATHELKRELTRPGVMVGKLRYNAPEQVRDKAFDGRSDVYSAAVVLYEFIANERFYEGLAEEQVWRVAMKGDHRPRSWWDIDEEWRNLLDVALQNDPMKRYGSAGEFRDALLDVAEARGIDLKNMRREASKFMREAFAAEQAQEREMILRATGIAEARTRLFRSPSEMQSALGNLGASVSVEVKTEVFDPTQHGGRGAEHLRELRNMMSRLADPNAETQLPGEPIIDDEPSDETFHVDASAYGSSANQSAVDSAPQRVADAPALTVAARRPRGLVDSKPDASNPPTHLSHSRSEPLPPLPPKKGSASPFVALLLGLVAVAVIGVVAIVAIPYLIKPPARLLDAGVAATPVDAGAGVVAVLPVDADAGIAGPIDAGVAAVVDAGVGLVVDSGVAQVVEVGVVDGGMGADDPPQKKVKKKTVQAPPPPQRATKSFKDQVDYLRQYCLTRVACARSVIDSASSVMSLTTVELRSLKEAAPKCVERCQQ